MKEAAPAYRKTKIVCTLGPASMNAEMIAKLIKAGMNATRLNFSHGHHEDLARTLAEVRNQAAKLGKPVAVIGDLQGPKLRIGEITPDPQTLSVGDKVTIRTEVATPAPGLIPVKLTKLDKLAVAGDILHIADGEVELKVLSTGPDELACEVFIGGVLTSHKGINFHRGSLNLPLLSEKDLSDIGFAVKHDFDFLAVSFVRRPEDVHTVREVVKALGGTDIHIIAKIERHEALERLPEIVAAVDGLMVARGDLGIDLPLEQVPLVQKELIRQANRFGRPVITATQMLLSMVHHIRPTRAEVTDVANAVLDGTDAVMLSEETAMGDHPDLAVAMMDLIATAVEGKLLSEPPPTPPFSPENIKEAVSHATCELAKDCGAHVILSPSVSGVTPRRLSAYRPRAPIIAFSPDPKVVRQLALPWGVYPLLTEKFIDTDEIMQRALHQAANCGFIKLGDRAVICVGHPLTTAGLTNMVKAVDYQE